MKHVLKICLGIAIALIVIVFVCRSREKQTMNVVVPEIVRCNSIYHWKTVFDLDSLERLFLRKHRIERIYLRMFDIGIDDNCVYEEWRIAPIATTEFNTVIPQGVEIVPVVYITIDALREMVGREQEYAPLIVERMLAMCSYNVCGPIRELQLDCDWTSSTKKSYDMLCQLVRDYVHKKGIALSVTIRLHQLRELPPPVDRGVLMLYNTGNLRSPETKNSILDINDVKPYLQTMKYPLPLSYAYPTYGWGVKFDKGKFVSIVSVDTLASSADEHIRMERPAVEEVLAVKELVGQKLGQPEGGNILYHLDHSQLKNYADDEIDEMLAY